MKLSRNNETVTAIIAHSAKNNEAFALDAEFVQNNKIDRITGIFHEQFFFNAICFNGGPVQVSHFSDVADFHGFTFHRVQGAVVRVQDVCNSKLLFLHPAP